MSIIQRLHQELHSLREDDIIQLRRDPARMEIIVSLSRNVDGEAKIVKEHMDERAMHFDPNIVHATIGRLKARICPTNGGY